MAGYGKSGPFLIGDTGETLIVAEWHPDPAVIEAELLTMANKFEDWTQPLLAARQVMIEDTEMHFRSETDPNGEPWESLNDDYRAQKVGAGFPDQILIRTDALHKAATSEKAWFVDSASIYFREDALPPYGPLHQDGTQEAGAMHFATQGAAIDKMLSGASLSEGEIKSLGRTGRGLNLPARPFIGMSETAENEIEAIFIQHLWNTVEKDWGGIVHDRGMTTTGLLGLPTNVTSFGGGTMVRGAFGRFIGVHRF